MLSYTLGASTVEGGISWEYFTKGASDILLTYKLIKIVLIHWTPTVDIIKYHRKYEQHKA